jgi:hypothetical protein
MTMASLQFTVATTRCALVGVLLTVAAAGTRPAVAEDAKAILKATADYVSGQQTISLTFDSDIEVITPELEKIQFTSSGDALLTRPNRLRARRTGGYSDAEIVFDGKTISIIGHSVNGYAQLEAGGTIDQLITLLRQGHGIALPGADLLLSNAYDVLVADVIEAKHIGFGIIDGKDCNHLAFRNVDTDWQLWVEVGERPIPRKLVITSKTINGAPQYTLRIKDWRTGLAVAADAFTFTPPTGVTRLNANELADLDELPREAPKGGNR